MEDERQRRLQLWRAMTALVSRAANLEIADADRADALKKLEQLVHDERRVIRRRTADVRRDSPDWNPSLP